MTDRTSFGGTSWARCLALTPADRGRPIDQKTTDVASTRPFADEFVNRECAGRCLSSADSGQVCRSIVDTYEERGLRWIWRASWSRR